MATSKCPNLNQQDKKIMVKLTEMSVTQTSHTPPPRKPHNQGKNQPKRIIQHNKSRESRADNQAILIKSISQEQTAVHQTV